LKPDVNSQAQTKTEETPQPESKKEDKKTFNLATDTL